MKATNVKLLCEDYNKRMKQANKKENKNTNTLDVNAKKEEIRNKKERRNKDIQSIKKSLVAESIYNIFNESLGHELDMFRDDKFKRSLVNTFVEEEGPLTLLSSFKRSSLLLSEYARLIESTIDQILEDNKDKEQEDSIDIDMNTKDEFYEKLKSDDADEVISTIKSRVSQAEEEFIQNNMTDKVKIKEILRDAQEKIDKEKDETIKECYERKAKKAISDIRNRGNKNILESMIFNLSTSVLKDKDLKEIYMNENSLDMDKIVDKCKVMYTFLETLNTAKIKRINESYINDLINSLKK